MASQQCVGEVALWSGGEEPEAEGDQIIEVTTYDPEASCELELRIPIDAEREILVRFDPADLMRIVIEAMRNKIA